jgi:error-prone DNA polymerase
MKVHRPAEFYTALLNNQPMGFYSSSTLVHDAKAHGMRIRPVCVRLSQWFCTVEDDATIRLGLCMTRGLSEAEGRRMIAAREQVPFMSVEDWKARTEVSRDAARTLARIGALNFMVAHRRDGLWQVERPHRTGDLIPQRFEDDAIPLEVMSAFERLDADYAGTGVTTGPHPMHYLRPSLPEIWRARDLPTAKNGARIEIGGLVICRQRPGTAKGYVFLSLEDETGVSNAILRPELFERHRLTVCEEQFLRVQGQVQNTQGVILVKATSVKRLDSQAARTPVSHDFH